MADAITEKGTISRRQATKLLIAATAVATISGSSILNELGNRPTEEQEQAEKAMRNRSLTTYKVVREAVEVRRLSYVEGQNDPPTNFDRLSLNTRVKGIIWRTEYNPKSPGQEQEWAAIKYERDGREIIGFASTRYLERVTMGSPYSK